MMPNPNRPETTLAACVAVTAYVAMWVCAVWEALS
jgi:hypothetical protein